MTGKTLTKRQANWAILMPNVIGLSESLTASSPKMAFLLLWEAYQLCNAIS